MSIAIDGFSDLEVERGPWKLIWEFLGEGRDGDFLEEDPEDEPRLRASLYIGDIQVESYCTGATPTTPKDKLTAMAEDLFRDLPDDPILVGEYCSGVKGPMQQWTWRTI